MRTTTTTTSEQIEVEISKMLRENSKLINQKVLFEEKTTMGR